MKSACGSALLALILFLSPTFARAHASGAPGSGPDSGPDSVKVWVVLRDKGPARPATGGRAFENLPLYAPYLAALRAQGLAIHAGLKWQNRVSGRIAGGRMEALRKLPFVAGVSLLPRRAKPDWIRPKVPMFWGPEGRGALGKRSAGIDYGAGKYLIDSLKVDRIHAYMDSAGMRPGKGMRVAVIDADFHLGSPIFTAMKGRIRDQWDFVNRKPQAVDDLFLDSHGGECMSLIGGNLPGTLVGAAPEADFLLYRAEFNDSELYVEEDYVAAAIERAVDSGAQVINISLGYRTEYTDGSPDRPYSEFDGRTRPSSIAAVGAARRNVLVSVAMGNLPAPSHITLEPTLTAPADADSILSVGIVDSHRDHCSYSCTGPSADGRVKPEVVSMGAFTGCTVAVAATDSPAPEVYTFAGTSFAAPAIAGVAVLLRQLKPELSAEAVRQALMTTADRHDSPDGLVGYGLADAAAAARKLGVPVGGVLIDTGFSRLFADKKFRLYHSGGIDPIVLTWVPTEPEPGVQLIDLSGRLVPATVRVSGSMILIQPDRPLRSGIYIARVR
ncbi:MAG: Subtilisin-like serine protease [Fibrobacteres bacterium]|nr:Subtilisin-like serine protease [Fibrobacterota bacterium]